MNWTRPPDLRAQVQKLWDRGELLAALVTGEPLFPKRLTIKVPTSAEITDHFDEVRAWVGELRAFPNCRVEMREFRHQLFGANAVPRAVWIDTTEAALAIIGKQRAAARFTGLIEVTHKLEPRLLPWLVKRPLRALELADEWRLLLGIVSWVETHPAPGVYLRQVDIPGVHSKFIEAHRSSSKLIEAHRSSSKLIEAHRSSSKLIAGCYLNYWILSFHPRQSILLHPAQVGSQSVTDFETSPFSSASAPSILKVPFCHMASQGISHSMPRASLVLTHRFHEYSLLRTRSTSWPFRK